MKSETTIFEKVNTWIKHSVTLKMITVTILMLLLLIPASLITSIIHERRLLNDQAIAEVSSKWAGAQIINGPILTIPIVYEYEKNKEVVQKTDLWYVLPKRLNIGGEIAPKTLKRGIYEVIVYTSKLSLSGEFLIHEKLDDPNVKEIKFDQAFLTVGISDLRGIKHKIYFEWDTKNLDLHPGSRISEHIYSGVTIDLPSLLDYVDKPVTFECSVDLHGSQNMSFIPLGNTTQVQINSSWQHPSFNGNFLPDSREIDKEGFTASWSILQFNRNFPQSWIGTNQHDKMSASAFGVDLISPLDDYQKTLRSAKYAVMTIALTFLIFFLVEILNKQKIHPFQYALVGMALCLFYILLVSISEHSNFRFAYGVATTGIVAMVALYSLSIFRARNLTLLLVVTLIAIYGFLYLTLQLADYALLMGSIGLAIILGATMYFTRKIDWYKSSIKSE